VIFGYDDMLQDPNSIVSSEISTHPHFPMD